jgi:DnaJ-class molecular chaperone
VAQQPHKRPRPVARCSLCNAVTADQTLIQRPHVCDSMRKGVWYEALHQTDWQECARCRATGSVTGKACVTCRGEGWIYSRLTT